MKRMFHAALDCVQHQRQVSFSLKKITKGRNAHQSDLLGGGLNQFELCKNPFFFCLRRTVATNLTRHVAFLGWDGQNAAHLFAQLTRGR